MKTIKERPIELKILIIAAVIGGIVGIIINRYIIINEKTLLGNMSKDILPYFMMYVYVGLALGIIQLIVAYGLYRGMRLAWYLAVIGCCLFLIDGLIWAVLTFPNIFGILIDIAVLYLLYRPQVRKYFEKKNESDNQIIT